MDRCAHCKKSAADLGAVALKRCSKCKTTPYCSRDCQKADWKAHKKGCDRGAAAAGSSSSPFTTSGPGPTRTTTVPGIPIQVHSTTPEAVQEAFSGKVLFGVPEAEAYKRLIDGYRMRVEDEYAFEGNLTGLYGGEDPVAGFNRYLDRAERCATGVLPSWWSKEKRAECLALGMKRSGWSSLHCAVEKHDVQDEYQDTLMPMKVRVLAEMIYGRRIGT